MEFYGESIDVLRDIKIALVFTAVFIFLNLSTGLVIGFPLAVTNQQLIAGGVAPVVEELGFRAGLLSLISFLPVPFDYIINGAAFSLFHYYAYGESLARMSASFIGAFIFSFVCVYLVKKYDSILIPIFLHAGFNLYLLGRYFVFVAI